MGAHRPRRSVAGCGWVAVKARLVHNDKGSFGRLFIRLFHRLVQRFLNRHASRKLVVFILRKK